MGSGTLARERVDNDALDRGVMCGGRRGDIHKWVNHKFAGFVIVDTPEQAAMLAEPGRSAESFQLSS